MIIKLIAGLGNIGSNYIDTRHNFGATYIKLLAKKYGVSLTFNKMLYGYSGKLKFNNHVIQLLIPHAYINESGLSISTYVNLYQLSPEEILIAHDDLDLFPGKIKIKLGKNFNDSHRGLRNVVMRLQNKFNFYRLRIGIGKPKNKNKVINFVLTQPANYEKKLINDVIHEVIRHTEHIIVKDFSKVMNNLHIFYSTTIKSE